MLYGRVFNGGSLQLQWGLIKWMDFQRAAIACLFFYRKKLFSVPSISATDKGNFEFNVPAVMTFFICLCVRLMQKFDPSFWNNNHVVIVRGLYVSLHKIVFNLWSILNKYLKKCYRMGMIKRSSKSLKSPHLCVKIWRQIYAYNIFFLYEYFW